MIYQGGAAKSGAQIGWWHKMEWRRLHQLVDDLDVGLISFFKVEDIVLVDNLDVASHTWKQGEQDIGWGRV